jgi:hypothetical protein
MELDLHLDINGLGIIMYSPHAVAHIAEGENYFSSNYNAGQQVLKHINEGTIVGFCTSSPGSYILKVRSGYPSERDLDKSEFRMRLGIHVLGNKVYFNDLFALMDWNSEGKNVPTIQIEDGFYHVTLIGNIPGSGILGDSQEIFIYFNKLEAMPALNYSGVPTFCE